MANTAGNLGTTWGWGLGENNWKAAHDKNLRALDVLVQCHIIERVLTAPPATPADGDCYIPATGATGAWAGHANEIARWNGVSSQWEFWVPRKGWEVFNESDNYAYRWSGTAWEGCNFSFTQLDLNYYKRSGETSTINTTGGFSTSGVMRISAGGVGTFTGLTSSGGATITGSTKVNLSVPYATSGNGATLSSEYSESQFAVDVGQPWRMFLQPRKLTGTTGVVSLGASVRGASNTSVEHYLMDYDGTTCTFNKPLALNGATRPVWGTSALATMIGHTSFLYSYSLGGDAGSPTIGRNFYLDAGGALKALQTATGSSYPAYLQINGNGVFAYGTSVSNPTAGATISDMSTKWSVSKEGGCGFFGQAAPTTRPTVNAAAGAVLTEVQTLVNQIRTHLIACGLVQ